MKLERCETSTIFSQKYNLPFGALFGLFKYNQVMFITCRTMGTTFHPRAQYRLRNDPTLMLTLVLSQKGQPRGTPRDPL